MRQFFADVEWMRFLQSNQPGSGVHSLFGTPVVLEPPLTTNMFILNPVGV